MVKMPWRTLVSPDSEAEYLALLTYLPLRRFRTIPKFLRYVRAIQGQLNGAEGLVGYSLKARLLPRKFWTLSVWRDEGALMRFVTQDPHRHSMGALRPHMAQTEFIRWRLKGSEVPPSWEGALRRSKSA